jgi:hypothetical protein
MTASTWLLYPADERLSFVGNSIGGTEFRDKSGNDADGNAVHMYNYIISFLAKKISFFLVSSLTYSYL